MYVPKNAELNPGRLWEVLEAASGKDPEPQRDGLHVRWWHGAEKRTEDEMVPVEFPFGAQFHVKSVAYIHCYLQTWTIPSNMDGHFNY